MQNLPSFKHQQLQLSCGQSKDGYRLNTAHEPPILSSSGKDNRTLCHLSLLLIQRCLEGFHTRIRRDGHIGLGLNTQRTSREILHDDEKNNLMSQFNVNSQPKFLGHQNQVSLMKLNDHTYMRLQQSGVLQPILIFVFRVITWKYKAVM